jgi:bifunctional DNA-binding transcriptional regulator/antitoxin component of YhaV-PrlF toxin-antitoxin module
VTGEPPVSLFVPPETVARPAGGSLLVPPLAELPAAAWVLGTAGVDHSGRVRDRLVLAALGWEPGDRTDVSVRPRALVLRRVATGGVPIDARGRVFLPAGARALFAIRVDDRVLLAADPQRGRLIVYPVSVVAALLTPRSGEDGRDDDSG